MAPFMGEARAREILDRTGGWPALVAACCVAPQNEDAAAYCLSEMFRADTEDALVAWETELAARPRARSPLAGRLSQTPRRRR